MNKYTQYIRNWFYSFFFACLKRILKFFIIQDLYNLYTTHFHFLNIFFKFCQNHSSDISVIFLFFYFYKVFLVHSNQPNFSVFILILRIWNDCDKTGRIWKYFSDHAIFFSLWWVRYMMMACNTIKSFRFIIRQNTLWKKKLQWIRLHIFL